MLIFFMHLGGTTFLSDKEDCDAAICYSHTIRSHMLRIAKITWEKHQAGLGFSQCKVLNGGTKNQRIIFADLQIRKEILCFKI